MDGSTAVNTEVTSRDPNDLLSIDDFCAWANIPRRTFNSWCLNGQAPKRMKFGRHIRIRWADCLAWADARYVEGA
jgi:hypothetical protein